MSLLCDKDWKLKYTPDDGDLVTQFYVPALECAVRYDRLTGYFQAKALTLAARGIEGLVRNNGRMRLLVGCTLDQAEVEAIAKGTECRDQVKAHLLANPLKPGNQREVEALELLAWMVANQILDVQVAVPCDEHRRPIPAQGIFHEKAGIIEDKTGDRLAFNGSLNETEAGWTRNWESLNIFRSWLGDDPRVAAEEANFTKLWSGDSKHVITMPVPDAMRDDLLRFLPEQDMPARLKKTEANPAMELPPEPEPPLPLLEPALDLRRLVWAYIKQAPKMPNGGERVGEATANIEPWPHQIRAFQRLYSHWLKSPGSNAPAQQPIARTDWHKHPFVIASSHLMRRRDRAAELAEIAEPWDIIVVDEAHHARRKSPGLAGEWRPNRLLALVQRITHRTQALLLLTATPMQVHPVEVWDLLSLLGLPPEWHEDAFLKFCAAVDHPSPSHEDMEFLAGMFRATEKRYGHATEQDVKRAGATSGLQAKRVLTALRDSAAIPRRQMDANTRGVALRLIRSQSPIGRLISRHTRDLLRRYHKAGKMQTPIADREVEDRFVRLSDDEARIYEAVENYISTTYNQAAAKEKNAVGFVMTIYRRRLASSFHALRHTLEDRLTAMQTGKPPKPQEPDDEADNETPDAEGDVLAPDEVAELEQAALAQEEKDDIASLLEDIRRLPPDTKAERLRQELEKLRIDGYSQTMVFTQYTDTMDFLRDELATKTSLRIMCFSGRGGEVRETDGRWRVISREEAKRRFRTGQANVLLCTDAAAEGLNFQFCGSLVNYDMPWNPMRVEQRIGRIDRLGQQHAKIRIINLHYEGTVEADVYMALRRRINLFESVVGRLQPILAKLSGVITGHILAHHSSDPDARSALAGDLEQQAEAAKREGFDLDAMLDSDLQEPPRPAAKLTLPDLDLVLQRADSLPPGVVVKKLQNGEYAYQSPGMARPVRITTRPDYFDDHSDSLELWSPGSPVFPRPDATALLQELDGKELLSFLRLP